MKNLQYHRRSNDNLSSSNDCDLFGLHINLSNKAQIDVWAKNEYALNVMNNTIVQKIRNDRVLRKLSRSMLSRMCGYSKRQIAYYEEPTRPDDDLPIEFLKAVATAYGLPPDRYFNQYHAFLNSDYGWRIDRFIQANNMRIIDAEKHFNVKGCALLNWRNGRTAPPRSVYEIIVSWEQNQN